MQRVYILGAGASHFARFPLGRDLLAFLKSEWENTKNPMVNDFGGYALDFVETVKHALPVERVLSNGAPDLEFVLSLTDRNNQRGSNGPAYDSLIKDLNTIAQTLDLDAWDLTKVRQGFTILVASAFQYKSYQLLDQGSGPAYDDFITTAAAWTARVDPGDTLITFNWDVLQEILLWKAKKWSYEDGYGIQTTPEKPLNPSLTTVLKLHGSCNWALSHQQDQSPRIDDADVFFGALKHDMQEPPRLGSTSDYGTSLIVPSYLKDPSQINILRSVWKTAAYVLRKAETLVVLGYSLPNADVHAQNLFSEMVDYNKTLKSITLVLGRDDESYSRWEALFGDYRKACKRVRLKFEEFVTSQ